MLVSRTQFNGSFLRLGPMRKLPNWPETELSGGSLILSWKVPPKFKLYLCNLCKFAYLDDYPALLKERIKLLSKLEGRAESRLPEFTEFEKLMLSGESEILKIRFLKNLGSADFLGINYYVTLITKRLENGQDRKSQSEYRSANLEGTLGRLAKFSFLSSMVFGDDIPAMGYQNRSWMP